MNKISLVIFDADGVLLDSLNPHLQICKDKSEEYGLGLAIPSSNEFRIIVRNGIKISPMLHFFKAVGFPAEHAVKATRQYNEIFMREYAPKVFPHVDDMLLKLSQAGMKSGIVTSNIKDNVEAALGSNMRFFDKRAIFTKDNTGVDSKADALSSISKNLATNIEEIIYVGDQPADFRAAKSAGVTFLGVSYGWGISKEDKEFPVVNKVMEIAEYILNKNNIK